MLQTLIVTDGFNSSSIRIASPSCFRRLGGSGGSSSSFRFFRGSEATGLAGSGMVLLARGFDLLEEGRVAGIGIALDEDVGRDDALRGGRAGRHVRHASDIRGEVCPLGRSRIAQGYSLSSHVPMSGNAIARTRELTTDFRPGFITRLGIFLYNMFA